MPDNPVPPISIDALLSTLIDIPSLSAARTVRKALLKAPCEEVQPAVIQALAHANHRRAFERLATLLAEMDGEEAVTVLAMHARTQRRLPRLAVQALALCKHSLVIDELLGILQFARIKQRRGAAYSPASLPGRAR